MSAHVPAAPQARVVIPLRGPTCYTARIMRTFDDKVRYRRPANPQGRSTAVIPAGQFCGDCPHRHTNPSKPGDEDGFCSLLDISDWHRHGFGLLWDGVKSCWINYDEPGKRERFGVRRHLEDLHTRPSLLTWHTWPYPWRRAAGWRIRFRESDGRM